MKKISYLATMLAALFMVACTSNDIPADPDDNVQGDRILKINIETLATKTEHPGAADQSYTKVEDGVIYFFKAGGNAVYAYRLTEADINTLSGANSPTLKDIEVTGVPLSAEHVVLITNLNKANNKTYPPFAGNTLSTIKGFTFDIKDQQPKGGKDALSPIAEVVMSGEADIQVVNKENRATITIAPVLSRLEIGAVRCINVAGTSLPNTLGDGQITKFRLRGVFIPNHYELGTVFGIGQNATYKSSLPADYTATFKNGLVDYYTAPNTLTKDKAKFFAYHTFPSVNTADMPNIVVAVDNIWFKDIDGSEKSWKSGAVQFFTVEKYKKDDKSDLPKFEAAKVYRINGADPGTTTVYEGKDGNGNVIIDKNGDPVLFDNTGKPIGNPIGGNGQPIPSIGTDKLIPIVVTLPGGSGGVEFGLGDLSDNPYDKNKTVTCKITIMPWTVVNITPSK